MMRYHVAGFDSPTEKIAQARALVRLLAQAGDPKEPYMQLLERERERIEKYTDSGFFHDDLRSTNQPFFFHEFMAQAERNGLQFLGEAELTEKQELQCPPHVDAALRGIDPINVVAKEQYRDFVRCRAFRRTLLCHQGLPLNRRLDAAPMERLFVAGEIRPLTSDADVNAVEVFTGQKKSEVETNRPLIKAALRRIGAAWPDFLSVPQVIAGARQDLQNSGMEPSASDASDICGALLQAGIAGVLQVHAHRPRLMLEPGERPVASALARLQVREGNRVPTCFHTVVQMDDALSRLLLQLIDGSRDRVALANDLQRAVRNGEVDAPVPAEQITVEQVDAVLRGLARLGLITG
jgi:methyltransferase-like protein